MQNDPFLQLLEILHSQWIYRNFRVHDSITGTLERLRMASLRKSSGSLNWVRTIC